MKIPKVGKVDDLFQEMKNHDLAYMTLRAGHISKEVDSSIQIPKILGQISETPEPIFIMERISGKSLQTLAILQKYGGRLLESQETIDSLSDF